MFLAGAATCDITNKLGTDIQGATCGGKAEYVRDPLEANALFLKTDETAILFVSCDFGGLEPHVTRTARASMAAAAGIPERNILIGATHTGGPSIIPTNYHKPMDTNYLDRLIVWLTDLAVRSVGSAMEARIRYGQGLARIGYNRRCCWADGTHSMFGDTHREDFVGLEGPDDPTHTAVGVESLDGNMLAVMHMNTGHPCTFYGASFYSADFPGTARALLRQALGDISVLFFNGAQGDICTSDIITRTPETTERTLLRIGALLAGETLRILHEQAPHSNVPISHAWADLEIPVRLPTSEHMAWALNVLKEADEGKEIDGMLLARAHGAALLQKTYGEAGCDVLPVHVVRIGHMSLTSVPCELFCHFGLEIRRRSNAPMTAILGLTDGYHGYCPTPAAIAGGGYSGEPIYWTRLANYAGDRLVDTACALIRCDKQRTKE